MMNYVLAEIDSDRPEKDKFNDIANVFNFSYWFNAYLYLFWENLAPISMGGVVPTDKDSELGKAINKKYGSFKKFRERFESYPLILRGMVLLVFDKNT